SGGTSSSSSSTGTTTGTGGSMPPPTCTPGTKDPPGFHVAVNGTPAGDGSAASPWDLPTALLHPPSVQPGDTIWLHGGVYKGAFVAKLDGADAMPITVRSYPGEWATLDGNGFTDPGL